jgi:hypothetical protein
VHLPVQGSTEARLRPAPAIDATPPVSPSLVRAPEIPGARRVGRNTLETLLFRGLSTPIALLLVVIQSRFLAPEGRGTFVLVVLSVTILSRLLGQLGTAVVNRMREPGAEVRTLVHRAFALAEMWLTVLVVYAVIGIASLVTLGRRRIAAGY